MIALMNYDRIYSTVLLTTSLDEHGRQASAGRCSEGQPQAQHRPTKRLSAATSLPYSNSLSISFRDINAVVCFYSAVIFPVEENVSSIIDKFKLNVYLQMPKKNTACVTLISEACPRLPNGSGLSLLP